ncbi:MAG TPA: class I tRNA ligase family protein, partial [Acidimicrobiales bacterium]|nr:class I tRNA ligase family protein [Acidimicrobiales bacterium]
DDFDWTDQTDQVIEGCGRFLDRLWRLAEPDAVRAAMTEAGVAPRYGELSADDVEVRRETHRTIRQVGADVERWSYNTAVARCMELVNTLQRYVRAAPGPHAEGLAEACDTLLLLLAPMAPHATAELWERRHPGEPSVHAQPWPRHDPALVAEETVTLVVQVNGKVRDRLEVDPSIDEEGARAVALSSSRVRQALDGQEPRRIVVRPPGLVNVVV